MTGAKVSQNKQPEDSNQYPLTSIYFYLSEGCNLSCSHCWLSPSNDPGGNNFAFLAPELFQKIVSEARPLGLKSVKLTGGEPLLHPDIMTILDIVFHEKLELIMETNGILCTPKLAAQIARQRNPFVSVSLDAVDAEIHDMIRGKKGAFYQTVQAIKVLVENNVQTQIIMSLMRDNVTQLEEMITLAEGLLVDSLKFNLVQPVGRGDSLHAADKSISITKLIALGRKVERELVPTTKLKLIYDSPPAFKSLKNLTPDSDGCSVCGINSILGVLPNGNYALCGIGSQVDKLVFGNAQEDLLQKVWQGNPTLQEIRYDLPEKLTGVCGRCLMKNFCLGSCVAHNFYRSGVIHGPFWFCEQAERQGVFPESRLN